MAGLSDKVPFDLGHTAKSVLRSQVAINILERMEVGRTSLPPGVVGDCPLPLLSRAGSLVTFACHHVQPD